MNDVTMMRMEGARASTVRSRTICSVLERSDGSDASPTSTDIFGTVWAAVLAAKKKPAAHPARMILNNCLISYMPFVARR